MRFFCGAVSLVFLFSVSPVWADGPTADRESIIADALKRMEAQNTLSSPDPDSGEVRAGIIRKALERFGSLPDEENRAPEFSSEDQSQVLTAENQQNNPIPSPDELPAPETTARENSEKPYKKPAMTLQGSLRTEVAHHIYSPSEFSKVKEQLVLTGRGEFSADLRFRVGGRAYYDAAYDHHDYYSKSAASDQNKDIELRDTYIDYSTGPWDLRLGKQQVVWGEAVGIFVADVVNAKDLREFILPDFDNIRIPEWGANLEYTRNDFHSEFVFLPGFELNRLGVTGSEFAYPLPVPEGFPSSYHDAKKPKDGFENAKMGTRFNYIWKGYDASVFYLHSWTPNPVLYRAINGLSFDFDPQYKRLDTYGATLSKEIEDIVFKADLVYTPQQYFPVSDALDADGIARSGHVEYLLGLDKTVFDKIDVNLQFIQDIILDHDPSMIGLDHYNSAYSLRLSRDFWNRKLGTDFLVIYQTNAPDFMYQTKLRYNLTDRWQLSLGTDVFSGKSSGSFGYFRKKSRIYSEFIYKF